MPALTENDLSVLNGLYVMERERGWSRERFFFVMAALFHDGSDVDEEKFEEELNRLVIADGMVSSNDNGGGVP